jgi:hypothetical protein
MCGRYAPVRTTEDERYVVYQGNIVTTVEERIVA